MWGADSAFLTGRVWCVAIWSDRTLGDEPAAEPTQVEEYFPAQAQGCGLVQGSAAAQDGQWAKFLFGLILCCE
jgi:hypothetical protein